MPTILTFYLFKSVKLINFSDIYLCSCNSARIFCSFFNELKMYERKLCTGHFTKQILKEYQRAPFRIILSLQTNTEELIRCVFDDNRKIIFIISS